jgi:sialate O-acetylesterase
MRNIKALIILIVACVFIWDVGAAEHLRSSNIFGSEMVLQRHKPVPIWGWAQEDAHVTVTFAGQTKTTKAEKTGRWEIKLDSMEASAEGRIMVITSGNDELKFTNILVGEVWLASGQSNMEVDLAGSDMPKSELKQLNKPLIRNFKVRYATAASPLDNLEGAWTSLNPGTAPQLSAVANYFAMKLQEELNIPIGILVSSKGGTLIEPWIPVEGFELVPELKKEAETVRKMIESAKASDDATKAPVVDRNAPGALYNAMISPLVGVAMRGAIWYQGEGNAIVKKKGDLYDKKMQALVQGWRKVWGASDFPFYFVQLPPCSYGVGRLEAIWEAQLLASRSITNCGMAVTTDLGDLKNIHPKKKKDVGERLARWALAKDYGRDIVFSGPLYKGFEVKDDAIVVSFDYAESGLSFKGEEITDVYVKGEGDNDFVKAAPTIEGSKLVVKHPNGAKPLAVRMGWNKNAQPNLTNKEGLPASPFRTDR